MQQYTGRVTPGAGELSTALTHGFTAVRLIGRRKLRDKVMRKTTPGFTLLAAAGLMLSCLAQTLSATPSLPAGMQTFRDIIDSLEVTIQARSRAGLKTDDLEARAALYRDSVAILRQIAGTEPAISGPTADKNRVAAASSLLGLFDIRAGLADLTGILGLNRISSHPFMIFFSGPALMILLLFGLILVLLSLARAYGRRNGQRSAGFHEALPQIIPFRPCPEFPRGNDPEAFGSALSDRQSFAVAEESEPETAYSSVGTQSAAIPETLEALILSAGEEGLSAREISRRLRVSVDQVGLAMAISKKR